MVFLIPHLLLRHTYFLFNYVLFRKDKLAHQTTTAEIYFLTFIAEHNIPFLAADHFNKLSKVMFPDSKIAQGFA